MRTLFPTRRAGHRLGPRVRLLATGAALAGFAASSCKSAPPPGPAGPFDAGSGAATVDSTISLVKGATDLGPVGNPDGGFGGPWIVTGLGIVGSSGGPVHVESEGIDGPVRVTASGSMFICPSEQAVVAAKPGEAALNDGIDGCIRFAAGGARTLQPMAGVKTPSSGRFFCLEAGGATVDEPSYVRAQKDCRVARLRLAETTQTASTDASIQAVEHVLHVARARVGKTKAASCEVVKSTGPVEWWPPSVWDPRAPTSADGGVDHDLGFTLAKGSSIDIRDMATAHLTHVTGPAHVHACVRENVRREDDRTLVYDGEVGSHEGTSDLLRDHWMVTSLGVLWFSIGSVQLTQAEPPSSIDSKGPAAPVSIHVTKGAAYLWTPRRVNGTSAVDAHGWRQLKEGDKEELTAASRELDVVAECERAVADADGEDALAAMDSTQIDPTKQRTARAACALQDVQAADFGTAPAPWTLASTP